MKPVILFDLDGTVIDSTEAILESFKVSFESLDSEQAKPEKIKEQIGYPLDIMYVNLGVETSRIDEHIAAYKNHYRMISCQKTELLDGAREAIEQASEFATLGVVTTKTAEYSRVLLEHMGLMRYFEVLIGREDVQNPKPDAEPILKALLQLKHDKDKTWMIGDTCMDIDAAKNAKVRHVAVTTGYATRETLMQCSSHISENLQQAIKHIKEATAQS